MLHRERFIQEIGSWLNGFNWDYYATLTFRWDRKPHSAKKAGENFILSLDPFAEYFIAVEGHRLRASSHLHFLIRGLKGFSCTQLMDFWKQGYSVTRIYGLKGYRRTRLIDLWYKGHGIIRIYGFKSYMYAKLMDLCHKGYGIARVYRYDPERGASYYLGKCAVNGIENWDIRRISPSGQIQSNNVE